MSVHDVRKYGARGDGAAPDTGAIRKAIRACGRNGGTVRLAGGRFLSGSVELTDGVTLEIMPDAVLAGMPDISHYSRKIPDSRVFNAGSHAWALVQADSARDVGVRGGGTIDGQGAVFRGARPHILQFSRCSNVAVRDVELRNGATWIQHYLFCDGVAVRNVRVHSYANSNNDGIDIHSSRNVVVRGCRIEGSDDAICLKSGSAEPCSDVLVEDCHVSGECNGFKLGTESNGGFRNITFRSCRAERVGLCCIAAEIVDGGTMENVVFSGIGMDSAGGAIFVRLGNRARPWKKGGIPPQPGSVRNILFENIRAEKIGPVGSSIMGLPGRCPEGIRLNNVYIRTGGGGLRSDGRKRCSEFPAHYPEFCMFGQLPAYGLNIRHARNVELRNVDIRVTAVENRPALLCRDVDGLLSAGLSAQGFADAESIVRLEDVRNAHFAGSRPNSWDGMPPFMLVEGRRTRSILVENTDPSYKGELLGIGAGAPRGQVRQGRK